MRPTTRTIPQKVTYAAFRIVTGILFWQHGAQKLFGWLGGDRVELASLVGLAGILEFFGGLMIGLGLYTRFVAFVVAGEMAVAYFTAHLSRGLWPIQNGGEPAVFFCFAFLLMVTMGSGAFSLDEKLRA